MWQAAAVQAGGDLLSSSINSIANAVANKRQRKWASEQADKANQWNLDMWNRANEYNSPLQQMQRFKEAGLNPNLIYGQGSSGNAQSPREYQQAQGQFSHRDIARPDMLGYMSQYQGIKVQKAQEANIMAQTTGQNIKNSFANSMLSAQLSKLAEETRNIAARTKNEDIRGQLMNASKVYRELSSEILRNDLELRRHGITYQDPWYIRTAVKHGAIDKGIGIYNSIQEIDTDPFMGALKYMMQQITGNR